MDLGILSLIFIYAILPNLRYRLLSNKVIKRASSKENIIALTFDDGPDPRYTPYLLDVLKKHDVKCTFFVLAENALKYPGLIKRICDEGHYIGLHSLKHTNAIFRLPNQTRNDFLTSINIMDKLGIKIRYFRPPWGMFNPMTFYYANTNNIKVILWSIHAMDWSRWTTINYIKTRLINRVRPGDIILLHDGRGSKDAPKKSINALEVVIPALKKRGYRFVLAKDL